jgi:hypothetical protein
MLALDEHQLTEEIEKASPTEGTAFARTDKNVLADCALLVGPNANSLRWPLNCVRRLPGERSPFSSWGQPQFNNSPFIRKIVAESRTNSPCIHEIVAESWTNGDFIMESVQKARKDGVLGADFCVSLVQPDGADSDFVDDRA